MCFRIATWCGVLWGCVLFFGLRDSGYAQEDSISGPIELDGDIEDGKDPGCSRNACVAPTEDDRPLATDWGEIFDAMGNVVGAPAGTVVASFKADCVNTAGRKDCSVFAGGDKNTQPVEEWEFNTGTNDVPPKDDITNVYAALVEDTDGDGNLRKLLYLATERRSVTGSTHLDFDIKRDDIRLNPPLGDDDEGPICEDCTISGSFEGTHSEEDIIVSLEFETGGRVATVQLFAYEDVGGTVQLADTNGDGKVDDADAFHSVVICEEGKGGKVECPDEPVECHPDPANGLDVCAAANVDRAICGGPWMNFVKQHDDVECIPSPGFNEVCIDVTALPLFQRCISTIIVKSRSSGSSISSQLKDFTLLKFDTCSDISGFKREVAENKTCGPLACSSDIVGPLQDWEIRLLDAEGNLVQYDGNGMDLIAAGKNPACTGADGFYEFVDIPNGAMYSICEVIPNRLTEAEPADEDNNCNGICGEPQEPYVWVPCEPGDGEFGKTVSPMDRACCPAPPAGCTTNTTVGGVEYCYEPFELTKNEERDFNNRKDFLCVDLQGRKFCDADDSGDFDPEEDCPLEGFCIVVTEADGTEHYARSGGDGRWIVTGLLPNQTVTVAEDITGAACRGGGLDTPDRSDVWVPVVPPSGGQYTVELEPDVNVFDLDFANASKPAIECPEDVTLTIGDDDPKVCEKEACVTVTASSICGPVSIECEADNDVVLTVNPATSVDEECNGFASVEICGMFPGGCNNVTTITCTATSAGGEVTCTFTVTVDDKQKPMITCPPDRQFECDEEVVYEPAECMDNCDPNPTTTMVMEESGDECERIITRTFTCTDECGNFDTCTQTITIVDSTEPTIDCPDDILATCDEPVTVRLTAEDNCDPNPEICIESIVCDPPGISALCGSPMGCSSGVVKDGVTVVEFPITLTATGTATITAYAKDRCGLTSTKCTFTVSTECPQGKITPTGTSCSDFTDGTAEDLTEANYTVSGGKIAQNVTPGVFFYYTAIVAPSSSFTIMIDQTASQPRQEFDVQNIGQVRLFDGGCTTRDPGIVTLLAGGDVRLQVSGLTTGATYVVSVKYDSKSIVDNPAPSPSTVHYDFATKVNGATVDEDSDGLDLKLKP